MKNNFLNNENFESLSNLVKKTNPKKLASALSNLDAQSIGLISNLGSDLEKQKKLYNEVNYYRCSIKYSHYAMFFAALTGFLASYGYGELILHYGLYYLGVKVFAGLCGSFLCGYLINIYTCASLVFSPNQENIKLFEQEVQKQNNNLYNAIKSHAAPLLNLTNPTLITNNNHDNSITKPS